MLEARYREAADSAREAIEVARAAGAPLPEVRALDGLGVSLAAVGDPADGFAALRASVDLARRVGMPVTMLASYHNLADTLNAAGRLAEARGVAEEARGRRGGDGLPQPLARAARRRARLHRRRLGDGRGPAPRRRAPHDGQHVPQREPAPRRPGARPRRPRPRAPPARRDGDARRKLARAAVHRRGGRTAAPSSSAAPATSTPPGARSTRAWTGSSSARRTSRASRSSRPTGVRVEADAALRARDLADAEAERLAVRRAEDLLLRAEACASASRPVEDANHLIAQADAARAFGREDADAVRAGGGQLGRPGAPVPRRGRPLARGRGAAGRRRSRRRRRTSPPRRCPRRARSARTGSPARSRAMRRARGCASRARSPRRPPTSRRPRRIPSG